MFKHLKLTELDYPVKGILKRGIILRAPMCSSYVLQIIFKKKVILQSKSPSFMCRKSYFSLLLLEIDLLTLKMTCSHQNSTSIGYSVKITHKGPRN